MEKLKDQSPSMGIGALARAVGLTEGTLRNWERRYGYPKPERTEGGHRVYRSEVAEFLSLVCRAMRAGYRPAQLLKLDQEQLLELVAGDAAASTVGHDSFRVSDAVMDSIRAYDTAALVGQFRTVVARVGLLKFVQRDAKHLVVSIGLAWRAGEIEIEHEHFAAEILRDFLSDERRALNVNIDGPRVVCSTLPGERHSLGLHMAACCLVASGYQVLFLGVDSPPSALAAAARAYKAVAVALSLSASSDHELNVVNVAELLELLPAGIEVWLGGSGAEGVSDEAYSSAELEQFCTDLEDRLPRLRLRHNESL